MATLTINNGENFFVEFHEEKNLLEIIRANDFALEASCGGKGTCGKCVVIIDGKLHKACETFAEEGMIVTIPPKKVSEKILTQTGKMDIEIKNIFSEIKEGFGLAVDVGTTTIAAYLYNISSGERVGIASSVNPQKIFGADVISRIDYTMKGEIERKRMQEEIVNCVQSIVEKFSQDISIITFTGNTTMMHFLLNLDASGIAVAPFTPETTKMIEFNPETIGLKLYNTRALVLPSVSAYVGADTVSAILATGLDVSSNAELLVDIGTNGEIALQAGDSVWACSTAAGPAFEGANIYCGMPAVEGAISECKIQGNTLELKVIGDGKATGLCGSGVLDMIALLLDNEVVDFSGRMVDSDEIEEAWLADRIIDFNGANAFKIDDEGKVIITQKDVREIQNAKAAICAGIIILIQRAGISIQDIEHTFLAGGFGNFMNKESAIRIGLLPKELSETIITAGNAAGLGASMCLLNVDYLKKASILGETVKYVELSFDPGFSECYMENMMFGEE
ncbi:MAG: ASKHA domain-containing protein [Bacillota bacterium]